MKMARVFAMPNSETFTVSPIGDFVKRYLAASKISVDPFARNKTWFTHTNDLNPDTQAQHHLDAEVFLRKLKQEGVTADLGIFDPPYSPRQISECYKSIGLKVGTEETQNGKLYKRVRDAMDELLLPGAIVLSFGWQSAGMGLKRGYEMLEMVIVNHGGGHNDTICIAERKGVVARPQTGQQIENSKQEAGDRKMASREVVAPKVQLPANFVERLTKGIAESRASTVIAAGGKPIMRLLKDGDWVFGQSNEEVQEGSHWAINVATIEHGFVCWIDGSLRGETMTSVFAPKPEWPPAIEGTAYKEQRSFDMKCIDGDDQGTEVIYKVSSKSGMAATDKMFAALQARALEDKTYIFPVIQLGVDHYPHKKHGKIYTPVLNIVGWVDANGEAQPATGKANGNGAMTQTDDEEDRSNPPDAPRTRTRKAPLGSPAEAPQTTQQAHATAPVRRRPGR